VPLGISADRQRIDPDWRPGHERLGKHDQLRTFTRSLIGQRVEQLERCLTV
jgi:hypothetical protein